MAHGTSPANCVTILHAVSNNGTELQLPLQSATIKTDTAFALTSPTYHTMKYVTSEPHQTMEPKTEPEVLLKS